MSDQRTECRRHRTSTALPMRHSNGVRQMPGKNTGAGAELARILKELGNTADEVAAALQAKGIKGVRNTARFLNPLVRTSRAN